MSAVMRTVMSLRTMMSYGTEHQASVLFCQDVPMLTSHVYSVHRVLKISETEKSFGDSLIVTSL